MNAITARDKANQVNIDKNSGQYTIIHNLIEKAVNKGKYEIKFFEALRSDVDILLEKEGYTVSSHYNQKDGTTVTIIW